MKRKTKSILISILVIVLLGAAFGYYLFNKGPIDVKNSSSVKITAIKLYDQFSSDSTNALKLHSGKVLLVSGEVNTISTNQKNEKVILLKTKSNGAYVNCTLEEDPGVVNINDNVRIKGICSGMGQGDEELGILGDVYLTRCYLIK